MEPKFRALLTAERIERFVISANRRSSVVELSFVNLSKDNQLEWRDNKNVYRNLRCGTLDKDARPGLHFTVSNTFAVRSHKARNSRTDGSLS